MALVADCRRLVFDDAAELLCDIMGDGVPLCEGVVFVLPPEGSCSSHTPRTRWPAGRRESHETRNPEMTGNRLEGRVSESDEKAIQ